MSLQILDQHTAFSKEVICSLQRFLQPIYCRRASFSNHRWKMPRVARVVTIHIHKALEVVQICHRHMILEPWRTHPSRDNADTIFDLDVDSGKRFRFQRDQG